MSTAKDAGIFPTFNYQAPAAWFEAVEAIASSKGWSEFIRGQALAQGAQGAQGGPGGPNSAASYVAGLASATTQRAAAEEHVKLTAALAKAISDNADLLRLCKPHLGDAAQLFYFLKKTAKVDAATQRKTAEKLLEGAPQAAHGQLAWQIYVKGVEHAMKEADAASVPKADQVKRVEVALSALPVILAGLRQSVLLTNASDPAKVLAFLQKIDSETANPLIADAAAEQEAAAVAHEEAAAAADAGKQAEEQDKSRGGGNRGGKSRSRRGGGGGRGRRGSQELRLCFVCSKPGHMAVKCPMRGWAAAGAGNDNQQQQQQQAQQQQHRFGFPNFGPPWQQQQAAAAFFQDPRWGGAEQKDDEGDNGYVLRGMQDCMLASARTDSSDVASFPAGRTMGAFKSTVFLNKEPPRARLIDSGATAHMFRLDADFVRLHYLASPVVVRLGDGRKTHATAVGTVHLRLVSGQVLPLYDCLLVPGLAVDLISVARLVAHGGCVLFSPLGCELRLGGTSVYRLGRRQGGLFHVNGARQVAIVEPPPRSFGPNPSNAKGDAIVGQAALRAQEVHSRQAVSKQVQLVHRRLGHVNFGQLLRAFKSGAVDGFPAGLKASDFTKGEEVCQGCISGKHHKGSHLEEGSPAIAPLHIVHLDVGGPLPASIIGGYTSFLVLVDGHSDLIEVAPLRTKTSAETAEAFKKYRQRMETQFGTKIKFVRTDGGSEFKGDFAKAVEESGAIQEMSGAENHEQNGVAERFIRTVKESMFSMLHEQRLPATLWPEALRFAVMVLNRTRLVEMPGVNGGPSRIVTPYEYVSGRKADISNFHIFGSPCWPHIPAAMRVNWMPKTTTEACVYLGPCATKKAHRVWSPADSKVIEAVHVQFQEYGAMTGPRVDPKGVLVPVAAALNPPLGPQARFVDVGPAPQGQKGQGQVMAMPPVNIVPAAGQQAAVPQVQPVAHSQAAAPWVPPVANSKPKRTTVPRPPAQKLWTFANRFEPLQDAGPIVVDVPTELVTKQVAPSEPKRGLSAKASKPVEKAKAPSRGGGSEVGSHSGTFTPTAGKSTAGGSIRHPYATRSITRAEDQQQHWERAQAYMADMSARDSDAEVETGPIDFKTAWAKPEWRQAIQIECENLHKQNTFTFIPSATVMGPRLKGKWVFTRKKNADGTMGKWKARWVVRGFAQRYGINYTDTYAPTSRHDSLRLVLSIAASYGYHMHLVDIKHAFLNAPLEERIEMDPPEGYPLPPGARPGDAVRLNKSLYGLKQAPRVWNEHLKKTLKDMECHPLSTDVSVYVRKTDKEHTMVVVYVDDILIASNSLAAVASIKAGLKAKYELVDSGEVGQILGITIERDRRRRVALLSQKGHILEVIKSAGLADACSRNTPMDENEHLDALGARQEDKALEGDKVTLYRSLVGQLVHISRCTRPDIAYAVSVCSRYNSAPAARHMKAVKDVICYLKHTINRKLKLGGCPLGKNGGIPTAGLVVEGSADADYANDKVGRRSCTGYIINVGGSMVSWASKLQRVPALSTCESEYVSQCAAAKESQYVRSLLNELGVRVNGPTQMSCDNTGAIALIKNPGHHERTKHIDVQHHFVRHLAETKQLQVTYVSTELMTADILTKALGRLKHSGDCKQLGLEG